MKNNYFLPRVKNNYFFCKNNYFAILPFGCCSHIGKLKLLKEEFLSRARKIFTEEFWKEDDVKKVI